MLKSSAWRQHRCVASAHRRRPCLAREDWHGLRQTRNAIRATVGGVLVIAQVLDPDGRLVVLTLERWLHIVEPEPGRPGHEELSGRQDEVMATVSNPDERMDGRWPREE